MQRNDEAGPGGGRRRPAARWLAWAGAVLVLVGGLGIAARVTLAPDPEAPRGAGPSPTGAFPGQPPDTGTRKTPTGGCLAGERAASGRLAKVSGSVPTYRLQVVPDGATYDLRGARITGYPSTNPYPLLFGKRRPGRATCVLGGTVAGRQSRVLTWQQMKATSDGDGLWFKSDGGVIDGIRIDNVEDGIGTLGGDPEGVTIRNAHMTYIRDDCIENDAVVGLTVEDSLLDGCFFGLSQRPGASSRPRHAPPGERTVLDRVLLRLQPMPFDRREAWCATDGRGTGGFFKWSPYANRLVVKDSVLLAERPAARCAGPMHFPAGATFENLTLVWLGPGRYPGSLPAKGVTVTRDRRVWDRAKADWLSRHQQSG